MLDGKGHVDFSSIFSRRLQSSNMLSMSLRGLLNRGPRRRICRSTMLLKPAKIQTIGRMKDEERTFLSVQHAKAGATAAEH